MCKRVKGTTKHSLSPGLGGKPCHHPGDQSARPLGQLLGDLPGGLLGGFLGEVLGCFPGGHLAGLRSQTARVPQTADSP